MAIIDILIRNVLPGMEVLKCLRSRSGQPHTEYTTVAQGLSPVGHQMKEVLMTTCDRIRGNDSHSLFTVLPCLANKIIIIVHILKKEPCPSKWFTM